MTDVAHHDRTANVAAEKQPGTASSTLASLRDACLLVVIGMAEIAWLAVLVYAILRFT